MTGANSKKSNFAEISSGINQKNITRIIRKLWIHEIPAPSSMNVNITRLAIASVWLFLMSVMCCGTAAHGAEQDQALVKGLLITIHKSKQPGMLVIRLQNHTATSISWLPWSILHPWITILIDSPDGHSARGSMASPTFPQEDEISSAKSGREVRVLEPGGRMEIAVKITEILDRFNPKERAVIKQALHTRQKVELGFSFDYLVVGVGADRNPVKAFRTSFDTPDFDLAK